MANTIQIKRSSVTAVPVTLAVGELAYSEVSDTLFIGESGSNVTAIGGGADVIKLSAIEAGATADMTGAEIKVVYEGEANTNAFTDALISKLNAVEAGAEVNLTDSEVKTAYEANANTNAFTDGDVTKLAAIEVAADVTDATNVAAAGAVMESDTTTALMSFVIDEDSMSSDSATKVPTQQSVKAYVDTEVADAVTAGVRFQGPYVASTNAPDLDASPIAGITKGDMYTVTDSGTFFSVNVEAGDMLVANIDTPTLEAHWTIVQSNLDAAAIKSNYESNADTNEFSDAFETKLIGIEAGAEVNLTNSEVKTAYETNTNTNAFTDAEQTKLTNIEVAATADQTGAEIKSLYEAEANTNEFSDAEQTKLANIATTADNYVSWTISDGTNTEAIGSADSLIVTGAGSVTTAYDVNTNIMSVTGVDTTYVNLSEFTNDTNFINTTDTIDGGTF